MAPSPGLSLCILEFLALRISTLWRTCRSTHWPWIRFVGSPWTFPRFTTSIAALITPPVNGTLRHQDFDLALSQRAQEKVDKYREGYMAPGLR